jgi:nitrite reductase/ring-hydroxylating ferredoxin subunit
MPDSLRPRPVIAPAQPLCTSAALAERGTAQVFDVLVWRQPARAFVLRFDGEVVGYVNRCAHVPTEMDWQPGKFLDQNQRYIVCTFHGALYEPRDGHCVYGPCRGQRLMRVPVSERDGQVWWHPTLDIHPATLAAAAVAPPAVPDPT